MKPTTDVGTVLLDVYRAKGFRLRLADDGVRVSPASELTPEDRATIVGAKPAIRRALIKELVEDSLGPTEYDSTNPTNPS